MSENKKRYYWLKLNENFFERDEMKVLENMPNGKDYIIFYLKLLLKSISAEGMLIFREVIPFTPEMLSSITNTSVDTVRVATDLFIKLGLMELWDDGTLFMTETINMIGSETDSAKRMRKLREREKKKELLPSHCDESVRKSDTEIDIEKDIDIDIDKEKEELQQSSNDDNSTPDYGFDEHSVEIQLARFMISEMLKVKPDSKIPSDNVKNLQGWAQHIDYMIRLDGRHPKSIATLFRWAQQDSFWCANIRSPKKLREKWDALELQMQRNTKSNGNNNQAILEDLYRQALEEEQQNAEN